MGKRIITLTEKMMHKLGFIWFIISLRMMFVLPDEQFSSSVRTLLTASKLSLYACVELLFGISKITLCSTLTLGDQEISIH